MGLVVFTSAYTVALLSIPFDDRVDFEKRCKQKIVCSMEPRMGHINCTDDRGDVQIASSWLQFRKAN